MNRTAHRTVIASLVAGALGVAAWVCMSPDGARAAAPAPGQAAPARPAPPDEVRDLPAFLGPLDKPVAPKDNPTTDAKIELGRMLYFDPRLSGNGSISCASCHNPALGFGDGLAKGIGIDGTVLDRSSPSVLNAAYYKVQFWDGRAPDLEEQAKGPMLNPNEMGGKKEKIEATLKSIPGYVQRFKQVFGTDPTFDNAAKAIAAFERICVDVDSPFDRWARGDDKAMSPAAVRGFEVFTTQGKCATCHSGPNFSDSKFHNIGVNVAKDKGRVAISNDPADQAAFRTPTVRNAALTGPYMHDGSVKTLRDVIEHYEDAPRKPENKGKLSPLLPEIRLSEAEKADLEAFMHALTGDKRDPRIFTIPELPQ